MKLTYLYHSGFAIEGDSFVMIIDYYSKGHFDVEKLFKSDKKIYVLSSHSHFDHFDSSILKWHDNFPGIRYVLSGDIAASLSTLSKDFVFIDKNDVFDDGTVKINAFGSTDQGVSFLVQAEDKTFFHAGDLNNWHWSDHSTANESARAEAFYLSELADITKAAKSVDLAMFPVDHRLGTDYTRGARQFLDAIKVKAFSPMHFGGNYESVYSFKPQVEKSGAKFIKWSKVGDEVEF